MRCRSDQDRERQDVDRAARCRRLDGLSTVWPRSTIDPSGATEISQAVRKNAGGSEEASVQVQDVQSGILAPLQALAPPLRRVPLEPGSMRPLADPERGSADARHEFSRNDDRIRRSGRLHRPTSSPSAGPIHAGLPPPDRTLPRRPGPESRFDHDPQLVQRVRTATPPQAHIITADRLDLVLPHGTGLGRRQRLRRRSTGRPARQFLYSTGAFGLVPRPGAARVRRPSTRTPSRTPRARRSSGAGRSRRPSGRSSASRLATQRWLHVTDAPSCHARNPSAPGCRRVRSGRCRPYDGSVLFRMFGSTSPTDRRNRRIPLRKRYLRTARSSPLLRKLLFGAPRRAQSRTSATSSPATRPTTTRSTTLASSWFHAPVYDD